MFSRFKRASKFYYLSINKECNRSRPGAYEICLRRWMKEGKEKGEGEKKEM